MDQNLDLLRGDLLQLFLQLGDLFAALANDNAGTGGVNRNHCALGGPVDLDPRNTGLLETVTDVVTDHQVFLQFSREFLVGIPIRVPRFRDAEPESYRMCFLTQESLLN